MKNTKGFTQYLIGTLFTAFGLYQIYQNDIWEFALYTLAGAAFISIGLIKDQKLQRHQKVLSIISWILIITSGLLLLFMVQTDG